MVYPPCTVKDIYCQHQATEACVLCHRPVCVGKYCSVMTEVPVSLLAEVPNDTGLRRVCKACIVSNMPAGWALTAARKMTGKVRTQAG